MLKLTAKILGRRTFLDFIDYTKPDYIFARHSLKIIEKIQDFFDKKIKFLFIGVPPRHGKSELASVRFPAYHLGLRPTENIIHMSHSADLTNEFSRQVRTIVRDSTAYNTLFPHIKLDPERAKISDWKIAKYGGGFRSVGVQGAVSGYGADTMIIDDPHKEGDIDSPKTMQDTYIWYVTGARTRLSPDAGILFPMTRWGRLDLMGQLLTLMATDPNADQWVSLVFPALAEVDDILGRKPGEALWEDRYTRESLLSMKALDDRRFQAMFQNNPLGADDSLFEKEDFRIVSSLENSDGFGDFFWSFDLASSEKEIGDYTVACRMAYNEELKLLYCSHVIRRRLEFPRALRLIRAISIVFADEKLCLPKHLLELLAMQLLKDKIEPSRFMSVDQKGDKKERAGALATVVSNGRFYIRNVGDYMYFINEHSEFPQVVHDDCVDTSSVATHYLGLDSEFHATILALEEKETARKREEGRESWLL